MQAVDGLDFTVARGETLSLVGESGCGMGASGRLLTRLLEPTAGRIGARIGRRQRIGIARTLVPRPKLIVADAACVHIGHIDLSAGDQPAR